MRAWMYWIAWGVSQRLRSVERAVTSPRSSSLSLKKSSSSYAAFFDDVLAPVPGLRRGNEDVHDGEGDADCEVLLEDGDLFAVGRLDKVDEDFFLTRPEPPRIDLRLIFVHGNSWHKRQPASSLGVLCKSEDKG